MAPQHTPSGTNPIAVRSTLLRRLITAQESGLIIVIAIIMAALTVYGNIHTTNQTIIDSATGTVARDEHNRVVRHEVNAFLNTRNLIQLANNASFIAVMAVGMTAVIVTAGIDLSVGSIYALAGIIAAMIIRHMPAETSALTGALALIGVACAIGAILGLLNGSMIVGLKLHPFIITLGTMSIFRGAAFLTTKGQTISGMPQDIQSGFFKQDFGLGVVHPMNTIIMLLITVLGWAVLKWTVFGRRVFAVGGNETAARYAGIPVGRIILLVYTLMGLLSGLSAAMAVGYFGSATTGAGQAYELRVIAAAVIGGASLAGGRGTAFGAVLGAIVIELINNAISILNIDNNYLLVVTGSAIIIAAAIDRIKQGVQARKGA